MSIVQHSVAYYRDTRSRWRGANIELRCEGDDSSVWVVLFDVDRVGVCGGREVDGEEDGSEIGGFGRAHFGGLVWREMNGVRCRSSDDFVPKQNLSRRRVERY